MADSKPSWWSRFLKVGRAESPPGVTSAAPGVASQPMEETAAAGRTRRILRVREDGGSNGDISREEEAHEVDDESSKSHEQMLAARTIAASSIVEPKGSQARLFLDLWISGIIQRGTRITEIADAPKASHIVEVHTSPDDANSLPPLFSASTAIHPPPPSSGHIGTDQEGYIPLVFTLLDTDKDENLSFDDVEAIAHVYGLDPAGLTSVAPPPDITNNANGSSSISEQQFKDWILSRSEHDLDLFAIRYPFKFLRLVSYWFQNECYLYPYAKQERLLSPVGTRINMITTFMHAVLQRTFGKKLDEEVRRLFGHIGIIDYVNTERRHDGSYTNRISAENIKAVVRVWGLTAAQAEGVAEEVNANLRGVISYDKIYRMYLMFKENNKFSTKKQQDPSELFPLLDRDKDGFLSRDEIRHLGARFYQELSEEEIDLIISSFDFDRDGRLGLEDFRLAMLPILKGTSWEVWLVGVAFAFLLAANPTLLIN